MYACLSRQGTAMAETAICVDCAHRVNCVTQVQMAAQTSGDWDGGPLQDCTQNEELFCVFCGVGPQQIFGPTQPPDTEAIVTDLSTIVRNLEGRHET